MHRLSSAVLVFFHCFAPLPSPWLTGVAEKANRCAQYVFYQVDISIPLEYSAIMIPRLCALCSIFRPTAFSVMPRAQRWPCSLWNLQIKSRPQSAERAARLLGRQVIPQAVFSFNPTVTSRKIAKSRQWELAVSCYCSF